MNIKKGDNVLIISGKDRGRKGKVIKALPDRGRVVVEGINIHKKHAKPRKQGEKGQVVEIAASIDASNAKLICPKCSKASRVGYRASEGDRKYRICKKCKEEIR